MITKLKHILLGVILLLVTTQFTACNSGEKTMFFKGKDALIEKAINADNATEVANAIQQGVNPNAVGLHGVTPIIVTAGNLKFNAMKALLKHKADPNTYDNNGDNAVTLAAQTYINGDKRYLELLLDNGGDPNSKLPDEDPLLVRIALLHDMNTIKYLVKKGADVNAYSRTGRPLITYYAGDWDIVWILIELGAKYNYTDSRFSLPDYMKDTVETPPGSPLFDAKEKVWRKLCESGIEMPPLTTKETWDWYYEDEPRPDYEMPLISCDHTTKTIIGKWDGKKPKVVSAYDKLKERGEL